MPGESYAQATCSSGGAGTLLDPCSSQNTVSMTVSPWVAARNTRTGPSGVRDY